MFITIVERLRLVNLVLDSLPKCLAAESGSL
jgi:hypothetical protein